jgi:heme/copper-type cytochrome/quinol oxidase subunit 2
MMYHKDDLTNLEIIRNNIIINEKIKENMKIEIKSLTFTILCVILIIVIGFYIINNLPPKL